MMMMIEFAQAQTTYTVDPWEQVTDGRTEYPGFTALVGDTVDFIYGTAGGSQDVWIHDTNNCEMGPSRTRVKGFAGPSGSYTFVSDDAETFGGKVFFACDIGQRCESGQQLLVTVYPTEADRQRETGGTVPTPAPVGTGDGTGGGNDGGDGGDDSSANKSFLASLLAILFMPVVLLA